MIPVAKPLIGPEEEAAVIEVLRSGMLAQGPVTARFEAAFAEICGTRHAVAVSSGTAALHLALLAHGIGPGDEVITSPFSFIATANAVLMCGAQPVFVDIDPDDYNIAADQIEAAITPQTKAIMPVHLYGQPTAMDAICAIAERHGLALIEDAAQAVGATYRGKAAGSFGTGCFSLYATKNITTGEGGMITTNDDDIAARLRLLRQHGQRVRYYHESFGYNFRLTDLQAAIGLAQLDKLEQFTEQRIANATWFNQHITHPAVITPVIRPETRHVFHQYTVRLPADQRESAIAQLQAADVGSAIFYPLCIPHQPFYLDLGYKVQVPIAERICQEVLALPVHPGISEADRIQIVAAINGLDLAQSVSNSTELHVG